MGCCRGIWGMGYDINPKTSIKRAKYRRSSSVEYELQTTVGEWHKHAIGHLEVLSVRSDKLDVTFHAYSRS